MSADTTRRALLTGTAAVGAGEVLAYVRPARVTAPDAAAIEAPEQRVRKHYFDLRLERLQEEHRAAEAILTEVNEAHSKVEDEFIRRRQSDRGSDRDVVAKATGFDKAEEAQKRAVSAVHAIVDTITAAQARSLDGLKVKAAVSAVELPMDSDLLASIAEDILRIAAKDEARDQPATFEDYAEIEFAAAEFESGMNAVEVVKRLYDDTWPVVSIMVTALQRDHNQMADFRDRCEQDSPGMLERLVTDTHESQAFFLAYADLMDNFETRLMAGAARAAKRRGMRC